MKNPIHVYFGVRTPADIYGMQWLTALASAHKNLQIHLVVTIGNSDPEARSGLVTDAIAQDWANLTGWRAYLCGAPPMVEAASLLVQSRGIKSEHIHADAFYASAI